MKDKEFREVVGKLQVFRNNLCWKTAGMVSPAGFEKQLVHMKRNRNGFNVEPEDTKNWMKSRKKKGGELAVDQQLRRILYYVRTPEQVVKFTLCDEPGR